MFYIKSYTYVLCGKSLQLYLPELNMNISNVEDDPEEAVSVSLGDRGISIRLWQPFSAS
jgi:hypothetical protein